MPWDGTPTGGFTGKGVRPWLPLGDSEARNVADQRADPGSVLSLCRDLIALRRSELGGVTREYESLLAGQDQWVYRTAGLLVAANFSDETVPLPAPAGEVILRSGSGSPGSLAPWEGVICRLG